MSIKSALTATEPGATFRVVRAAKDRRCEDGSSHYPMPCPRMIRKGEQYVRAVQFKNHDVYSWIDPQTRRPLTRPMVTVMCFQCAEQYHTTGLLVIDAQRQARAALVAAKGCGGDEEERA